MDHADARALIDLAAAEPDGLARLMAGDTADSAALAAHLAGCPPCTAEVDRVRRSAAIVRDYLRDRPRPDLRERTLAHVRAVGVPRTSAGLGAPADPIGAAGEPDAGAANGAPGRPRRRGPAWWRTAAAAAVLLAVVGTTIWGTLQVQSAIDDQRASARELARVTAWTLRIDGAEDARRVTLTDADSGNRHGTLVFSPSTGELVVVAMGLSEPPAGRIYRCWVDVDGTRRLVGRMFFGGGIAYWAGRVDDLGALPGGATFGVGQIAGQAGLETGTAELLGSL